MDNKKPPSSSKISMHSIKNILGNQEQISLFSEHDKEFANEFYLELFNPIKRFGIELTDIQFTVMEGILRGFSETEYKGNLQPLDKNELVDNRYAGKQPESYKYIQEIPRLRATQSQILSWSEINKNSIASRTRAIEALLDLGSIQFCFYYDRLSFSEDGKPELDKNGKWKKEQVTAVDTLFTIKKISEKNSEAVSYYEITPSSIFLDQIDGYFLLIPYKWREEVRKLFGNKKTSAYTFRFLLFLRYQYELKRRRLPQGKQQFELKWSPEEVAVAIKMPESIYIKKKHRMNDILDDAYSVAKQLGYITEFSRKGHLDVLIFNEKKYSQSNLIQPEPVFSTEEEAESYRISNELLALFIDSRKKIDPDYQLPQDVKNAYSFLILLKEKKRNQKDIAQLIIWSQSQSYWATRLSTPEKFEKLFSEAWIEYKLSKKHTIENTFESNKTFAFEKLKKIEDDIARKRSFDGPNLSVLSKCVEFVHGNSCLVIEYTSQAFREKVSEALKQFRIPHEEFIGN